VLPHLFGGQVISSINFCGRPVNHGETLWCEKVIQFWALLRNPLCKIMNQNINYVFINVGVSAIQRLAKRRLEHLVIKQNLRHFSLH
jgi:hypothetical protein